MELKKSKLMVVAPMMAMFAPFLKSPPALDAGGSGSPKCSAVDHHHQHRSQIPWRMPTL